MEHPCVKDRHLDQSIMGLIAHLPERLSSYGFQTVNFPLQKPAAGKLALRNLTTRTQASWENPETQVSLYHSLASNLLFCRMTVLKLSTTGDYKQPALKADKICGRKDEARTKRRIN